MKSKIDVNGIQKDAHGLLEALRAQDIGLLRFRLVKGRIRLQRAQESAMRSSMRKSISHLENLYSSLYASVETEEKRYSMLCEKLGEVVDVSADLDGLKRQE
jgi:hypothetical protein